MKPFFALLQFTTTLPLGKPQEFEHFARHSYLYPLAGYVIGGIVALLVFWIPDPAIAAAVAIAALFLLTGCNHFDGLVDLGDALMAHGDRERRIRALTDRQVGAGGIATAVAVTFILFAGLQASASVIAAVLTGEVCAKFSMALLTSVGKPFDDGIHGYLFRFSRPYFPVIAFFLCLPLILLPVPLWKLAAAAVLMVLCPLILLMISGKLFGGINGDIVGASNEITRAAVIVLLALI
jgi:adenosylcobinamide-GDP ribazoletransferase